MGNARFLANMRLVVVLSLAVLFCSVISGCDRGDSTPISATVTDTEAVALDKTALSITYVPGDSETSVTGNLTLPQTGTTGATITWSSSGACIICSNGVGTVARPAFGAGDENLTLTATISKGAASDTKVFTLTVKEAPQSDALAVAADKAALAITYVPGDSAASVTGNLTLAASGPSGTTISWSSNNTSAISNAGTVTRPAGTDAAVTMTATISRGAASDTKIFNLTVKQAPQSDAQAVAADKAALAITYAPGDNAASVTGNLTLAASGPSGTTISWSSNNTSVISNAGAVTRPAGADAAVTMTATISKGAASDTRAFNLTVKAAAGNPVAGAINLPETGQRICYNSAGTIVSCATTAAAGEDGALQKGVAWPNPRFTNADNSTPINGSVVVDQLTGLMWTQDGNAPGPAGCSPAAAKTWKNALDHLACLNTNSYLGYTDWRLPNRNELRSLVNFDQAHMATWLNAQGFTNVQIDYYWSSTAYTIDNSGNVWAVYMDDGYPYSAGATNLWRVWPVRAGEGSGAPAEQPKTGQTICYNSAGTGIIVDCATAAGAGEDGALQKGVAWPNPRFTNADNSTPINGSVVVDQLTGLMWTKDGNAPGPGGCSPAAKKTWQGALDYATCLNTNSYLGYTDWRLPNVNELESLVYVSSGPDKNATWLNAQGFTNVQFSDYYWSSTSYINQTDQAWWVTMWDGDARGQAKANSYFVWPVRAGQ